MIGERNKMGAGAVYAKEPIDRNSGPCLLVDMSPAIVDLGSTYDYDRFGQQALNQVLVIN
jgi:hypothetical protein